jgi:intracellular septation protein
MTEKTKPELSAGLKAALDFLPLAAFFAAYMWKDLIWATGALLVATLVVTAIIYALTGKLSKQQLVTAALVTVFGAMTLYFKDPAFIKAKVSVVNALFGAVLLGGLKFNRMFLGDLLGEQIKLPPEIWRTLTIRWGLFFFAMALLNIIVWLGFSEATWVSFKTVGLLALTFVFVAANAPFMMKHMMQDTADQALKDE